MKDSLIAFEGRDEFRYREGDLIVIVGGERLIPRKGVSFLLYPGYMRVLAGQQLIDDTLRTRIADRIQAMFVYYGWGLDIVE